MDQQLQQQVDVPGLVLPSSPTNSSVSSDLDTQSTGSFFPDRSMTLGTLMGVNVPSSYTDAAADSRSPRVPLRKSRDGATRKAAEGGRRRRGGRSWWRLCRDDMAGSTSLGNFLQIERGDAADFPGGHAAVGGERLFEDGRVLPPAPAAERRRRERVPVLLAGICTGGD